MLGEKMTYLTISVNRKMLKWLLNDHIWDCRSDSASRGPGELAMALSVTGVACICLSGVRHSRNGAPGQLSQRRNFPSLHLTAYDTDQNSYYYCPFSPFS